MYSEISLSLSIYLTLTCAAANSSLKAALYSPRPFGNRAENPSSINRSYTARTKVQIHSAEPQKVMKTKQQEVIFRCKHHHNMPANRAIIPSHPGKH